MRNKHAEGEVMRVQKMIVLTLTIAATAAMGCAGRMAYNLPPAQRLMQPGPGVGGPGPGVIPPNNQMMAPAAPATYGPGGMAKAGGPGGSLQQVQYCEDGSCMSGDSGYGGGMPAGAGGATSQIQFVGEQGLNVSWDVSSPGMFDSAPLFVPGRQDFTQGAIYRLRLSNIPGRDGVTLFPTLEVAPVTARTDAFLAHAAVPVQFTEEDFDQVMSGNFVTKVIYLPDPEFQELALSGVETLVSTRLDPGVDPVSEADRRGSILAVLRIGSKDLSTSQGAGYQGGIMPAQYSGDCESCGPNGSSDPTMSAPMMSGSPNMPMGMPTSGFAPQGVPPHMIAGAPQYGMPYTGTPIGLPGPPHIPLGAPAGLRKHTIKNRTRVVLPPPTAAVHMSVKQRPGLNYPRPVNKVKVDEVNRAPLQLMGGTLKPGSGVATAANASGAFPTGGCDTCE